MGGSHGHTGDRSVCCLGFGGMVRRLRRTGIGARRAAGARRQDRVRPRGPDGRRAGQRQEAGLDHHGHGGERCQAAPTAFPAARLAAGQLPAEDQGRRAMRSTARARSSSRPARPRRADLKLKPAPVRVRATHQCRIAGERARSARDEAQPAQLHGLPFAAPDFQLEAQPRRFQEGVRAHGHLLSGRLGHAAAAARRRAPPAGRQSGAGATALPAISKRSISAAAPTHRFEFTTTPRAEGPRHARRSSPNTICRERRSSRTT